MNTARKYPTPIELFDEVRRVAGMIPADLGGGSPVPKSFLMASIALHYGLKNCYYREPERLARLADNGCRKMRQIFTLEAQMAPRLALLRREIEVAETSRRAISIEMNRRAHPDVAHRSRRSLGDVMVRLCVALLRNGPPGFETEPGAPCAPSAPTRPCSMQSGASVRSPC